MLDSGAAPPRLARRNAMWSDRNPGIPAMPPELPAALTETVRVRVDQQRLVQTALSLIEVPSPTRDAGAVADRLADLLTSDGFEVERPVADWPESPAVVTRLDTGRPGRVLQFDCHLDTVHLPFVPPRCADGCLYGSGVSDMKGGLAAVVEALRVVRDTGALEAGGLLLTAHDHHEGPWGDRRQVKALIQEGYTGDAVMLPEYLADHLPVAGRGMAIFEIEISRPEKPVHEVLRPADLPDVLGTGVGLVSSLNKLHGQLSRTTHPHAGSDSIFIGQIHAGEIYNQSPSRCVLSGTRRWVTPGSGPEVRAAFQRLLEDAARSSRTEIEVQFDLQAEAFSIDPADPIVAAFQAAHAALTGRPLPLGGKPFADDGNGFFAQAGIPPLTHGPAATGAHTLEECAPIDELVRVAWVYALTALAYCR